MQYDNNNRGALFKNDKQGNEKRPDYKGDLNVEGVEYRVSAWIKKSKSPPVQVPVQDFVDDELPPF